MTTFLCWKNRPSLRNDDRAVSWLWRLATARGSPPAEPRASAYSPGGPSRSSVSA